MQLLTTLNDDLVAGLTSTDLNSQTYAASIVVALFRKFQVAISSTLPPLHRFAKSAGARRSAASYLELLHHVDDGLRSGKLVEIDGLIFPQG